ncbi:MAG: hypothetical protein NVS9B7_03700 [Flavisolibacter sp.]
MLQVLRAQVQQLSPVFTSLGPNTNGYYEYLPENYSATRVEKYPLLVFVEGSGELGDGKTNIDKLTGSGPLFYIKNNQFPTSFTVNGKTFQFVIITPQFVVRPLPSEIDKVITSAIEKYNVDINRIYLTGFSMGGGVSFEYAGNSPAYAQRLAALIPFSSATEPSWLAVIPRSKNIAGATLPVWAFHNHLDDVSDTITKNYVSFINLFAESPLAIKTIYDASGHDSWSSAYYGNPQPTNNNLNIYQWMLQFQRSNIVNPLPLKFVSFEVHCAPGSVELSWQTAQENNTGSFEAQSSEDGVSWLNLGTVAAAGNNSTPHQYNFKVLGNFSANIFYRIVEKDRDQKLLYSAVVKNNCSYNNIAKVYPNPVTQNIFVHINMQTATALSLCLYDSKGRLLFKEISNLSAGPTILSLKANHYPKGIYNLRLKWLNQTQVIQVVKP